MPIVLIPNTKLETPHYHIERLRRRRAPRDTTPSFNRAEDVAQVADDPYALKSQEDKPQRPKQVPVIKNVLPRDPAPVHPQKAEEAKAEAGKSAQLQPVTQEKGLFSRIMSFLFGSKDEKKEEEKKVEENKTEGKEKSKDAGREDRRRRGAAATPVVTPPPAPAARNAPRKKPTRLKSPKSASKRRSAASVPPAVRSPRPPRRLRTPVTNPSKRPRANAPSAAAPAAVVLPKPKLRPHSPKPFRPLSPKPRRSPPPLRLKSLPR